MTAPRLVGDGEAPKAPSSWTYDAVITGMEALTTLSKIGTKDKDLLKRLAKMLVWSKRVTQEFFVQRDTLINTWAERDDAGEIKVTRSEDGRSQNPVMKNGVEHQLAASEMLRGPANFEGEPPEPFKWSDLEKFQKLPDGVTLAQLGPFVNL